MPPVTLYDYRIAAGWNVALGSLTNIELIQPVGDLYFKPPRVWGTYDPGSLRFRADGSAYFAGYPSQQWQFTGLTRAQFRYLQTTYCANGYSGSVTIYTRLDATTGYVRYNAVMRLPKLNEVTFKFTAYQNVVLQMTRLAASS